MSGSPCSNCGAPLEGARYEVQTKCRHCGTVQDNRDVLAVGDEVMRSRGEYFELGTVRACRGPKEIDVDFEGGGSQTKLAFLDLVPVLRPAPDLKSGTLVFHKDMMGWEKTWTATDAAHGMVKRKHATAGFQDSFFDKEASLADIRVPAIASAAAKRSRLEAFKERVKDDPIGAVFNLFFAGFMTFWVAIFVLVIGGIIVGVACNR